MKSLDGHMPCFQGWTHSKKPTIPLYSNPCYLNLLTKLKCKIFGNLLLQLLGFLVCFSSPSSFRILKIVSVWVPQKLGQHRQSHCCSFFTWHFSIMRTTFQRKKKQEGKIMGCLFRRPKKSQ